jgi:histidinol dehydrogenase
MKRLSTTAPGFEADFVALLAEARETADSVDGVVAAIIGDIRARGDAALLDYTEKFDRLKLTAAGLRVSADEIQAATDSIPAPLLAALDLAATRIEAFHRAQLPQDLRLHDAAGLDLGMRWTPLDAVASTCPAEKRPIRPRC